METQVCVVCDKELPLSAFAYRKDNKKYRPLCKECRSKQEAARRYNSTVDEISELLKKQGHRCAICGIHQDYVQHESFKFSPLVIDHNHKTGRIRGLLCPKCNLLLGHADDSVETLLKAALYLTEQE